MPAYLISGSQGSGKSTVGKELKSRGYAVIETDDDRELSAFYHRASGKKTDTYTVVHSPGDWFAEYDWNWDGDRLKALMKQCEDKPVFFCGGANNDREFYPLFAKCFGLLVDGETLKHRLQAKNPVRFSDESHELKRVLAWSAGGKGYYSRWGMVLINSSGDIRTVVDEIVSQM